MRTLSSAQILDGEPGLMIRTHGTAGESGSVLKAVGSPGRLRRESAKNKPITSLASSKRVLCAGVAEPVACGSYFTSEVK